ncbi:MAG: acyl-CoA thioesterase [Chthoniobacterales bacterium]
MAAAVRFEIAVRVAPQDIDGQGHVNNVVYLRWAQEVATAHWETLAPDELRATIGWVVLRHEIDYKTAGLPGDELRVCTWVAAVEGLAFERHTEILRVSDARLLARVRTLWCPINPETGRPLKVSAELRALFSAAARTSL